MKKLFRSTTDRKLFGVCGGIAEYFNIDSTIVRLILIFLVLCVGTGVLAYLIAAILIPEDTTY
ncbi:MAG: PspC domain-containing protein [Clostridia bacterium]|nr:PspC domain-containing protein [Clostridia bacterium]